MNDTKLKVALIGAGAVASYHVRAIKQVHGLELACICAPEADKVKELAQQFDLPWTTSNQAVFDNPEIDVVDIAVPSGLHAELGIAAARAGKHVIVEKPIDVTLEKADALIENCRSSGVTLSVISQYRFLDPMLKIYELLRGGKLGTLIEGDAYIKWFRSQAYYDSAAWRGTRALDGGGPFINQGIHFIDLLLSVMGPAANVFAKTKTVAHNIEVEDIGMAIVEFQSGAFGVIQASTAMPPGFPAKLDIHGTKGAVSVLGEKLGFKHIEGEEPFQALEVDAGGAASPMAIDLNPFIRQFTDVASAIREKRQPTVSGTEARRSLQLILAIYESAKLGKKVYLDEGSDG